MSDSSEKRVSRRRTIQLAGATITAPAFVNVVRADTASGNVELDTVATVGANTSIDITIYEDTDASGTANNQETQSISNGTTTTEYTTLTSKTTQGNELWLDVDLSTTDDTVTPSLDSATLKLPDEVATATGTATDAPSGTERTEPQTAFELFEDYFTFIAAVVLSFMAIGLWGRSLAVGAFLAYVAFAYLAVTTGTGLLLQILYVTAVLIMVGMAFKLWRTEFGGE